MKKEKDEMNKKYGQKGGSMADLEKMILARRENAFKGFVGYMENKYANMKDEDDDEGEDWQDEDDEEEEEFKKSKNLNIKRKKKGTSKHDKIESPQKRRKNK